MIQRLLFLTLCLVLCGRLGAYGPGDGTPGNPYRLSTAADLQELSSKPADWGLSFALDSDVNMVSVESWPIGTASVPFTGTFDGGSHRIKNLSIYDNDQTKGGAGLFGVIQDTAVISGVILEGPIVMGNSAQHVGALIGCLNSGTVSRCAVEGGQVFGEVGRDSRTGGLVGTNIAGHVDQCYTATTVEGTSYCGGLIGDNKDKGVVTDCYTEGRIILRPVCLADRSYRVGGLIGENRGSVCTCYANAAVTILPSTTSVCPGCVGGLMGVVISGEFTLVSPVFGNFSNSAVSPSAVGCGTMTAAGAQSVSLASLKQKTTFKYWDLDAAWYLSEGVDTPRLRWQNQKPVAVASVVTPIPVAIPFGQTTASVTLDGSGSYDPDGDSLTYCWSCTTGAFSGAKPSIMFTKGVHVVTLAVNDGAADSDPITVTVTVNEENKPPVAEAGPDQTLYDDGTGQVTATLDGSKSGDPEGKTLTSWTWFVDGVIAATGAHPAVVLKAVSPETTDYEISLVVNDGSQDSVPDKVKVSVVKPLQVKPVCSPAVVGRRSTLSITPQVLFCVPLPVDLAEARASNVDPKAPIQLILPDGTTTQMTRDTGWKDTTIAVGTSRKAILNSTTANGKAHLRILIKLKTGRYIEGPVDVQIVAGEGPIWLEVFSERIGLLFKY